MPLDDPGVVFVVANSGIRHRNASGAYGERVQQCKDAVAAVSRPRDHQQIVYLLSLTASFLYINATEIGIVSLVAASLCKPLRSWSISGSGNVAEHETALPITHNRHYSKQEAILHLSERGAMDEIDRCLLYFALNFDVGGFVSWK